MKKIRMLALVLSILALSLPASASGLVRAGSTKGFDNIQQGVVDLSLENMLILRYLSNSDADTSSLSTVYIVGLNPHYFIMNNFSLGLNLNFLYQKDTASSGGVDTTSTETGFMGFLMANYYLSLGNNLFFKPGVGGGGFYNTRSVPAGAGLTAETKLYGGAAQLDLGFVFYASANFNLRAGVNAIIRFGKEGADGSDVEQSITTVDMGVNAGLGYSF